MCRRFRDPNPEEIEALSLDAMRESIMSQLRPDNLEVSIVGDIDASEVRAIMLQSQMSQVHEHVLTTEPWLNRLEQHRACVAASSGTGCDSTGSHAVLWHHGSRRAHPKAHGLRV